MLPYLILIFAPLMFYQIALTKDDKSNREGWFISIGKEPRTLNNSLIVPIFFLLFFVLLILRHDSVGRDTDVYHYYFSGYVNADFSAVLRAEHDYLYWLLNWVVAQFTDDFRVFLIIVSLLTVLPIAKVYCEDKQYGFLKIILFVNMSTFIMIFSGLRQSLAMAFGMIAYEFVRRKKPFFFLLFALIAFGFHHTAFMVLLFYPLYHMRLQKNQLWFAIPTIALVFIFNRPIFAFVTRVLSRFLGEQYEAELEDTGAYTMIILFILFAIAAFFFPDEDKLDDETIGLRNFLLITILLQCFAPIYNTAMRLNYYFILFVPITVPKILKHPKDTIKDVAHIAKIVMVGFFIVYFLYVVYKGCKTGYSTLDTYPYIPFWKSGGPI